MFDVAGGGGGGSPGGGGMVNTGSGLDEVEDTDVSGDTVVDSDQVSASVKLTSPLKSAVIAASAVCTKPVNISVCTPKSWYSVLLTVAADSCETCKISKH